MKPIRFLIALLLLAGLMALPAAAQDPGDILLQDDFVTVQRFLQTDEANFTMAYQEQGYRITNDFINSYLTSVLPISYTDAGVFVDAHRVAGPETGYLGTVCRWQDIHNFYGLVIGHGGFMGIARVQDGSLTWLAQAQEPDMIGPDTEVNRVGGTCWGDVLTLIVNGEAMLEARDTAFASGFAGLVTGTRTTPGLQVHFDNYAVVRPEAVPEVEPIVDPVEPPVTPPVVEPVPVETQFLVGDNAGAFDMHTLSYPALTEATVRMAYWPSDPTIDPGIGFMVWGEGRLIAEGTQVDGEPVVEAIFPALAGEVYEIQVYNYIHGLGVSYELSITP